MYKFFFSSSFIYCTDAQAWVSLVYWFIFFIITVHVHNMMYFVCLFSVSTNVFIFVLFFFFFFLLIFSYNRQRATHSLFRIDTKELTFHLTMSTWKHITSSISSGVLHIYITINHIYTSSSSSLALCVITSGNISQLGL